MPAWDPRQLIWRLREMRELELRGPHQQMKLPLSQQEERERERTRDREGERDNKR